MSGVASAGFGFSCSAAPGVGRLAGPSPAARRQPWHGGRSLGVLCASWHPPIQPAGPAGRALPVLVEAAGACGCCAICKAKPDACAVQICSDNQLLRWVGCHRNPGAAGDTLEATQARSGGMQREMKSGMPLSIMLHPGNVVVPTSSLPKAAAGDQARVGRQGGDTHQCRTRARPTPLPTDVDVPHGQAFEHPGGKELAHPPSPALNRAFAAALTLRWGTCVPGLVPLSSRRDHGCRTSLDIAVALVGAFQRKPAGSSTSEPRVRHSGASSKPSHAFKKHREAVGSGLDAPACRLVAAAGSTRAAAAAPASSGRAQRCPPWCSLAGAG